MIAKIHRPADASYAARCLGGKGSINDINPAAEKGFEFHLQATEVKERSSGLEFYEEVQVALPVSLPAGHGAEDSHVARRPRRSSRCSTAAFATALTKAKIRPIPVKA